MILVGASYTVEPKDYPEDGFTFWVEGAIVNGVASIREQYENGVFTADQAGSPFESGKEYRFLGSHPDYMAEPQMLRVVFDELGVSHELSTPAGTGATGDGTGAVTGDLDTASKATDLSAQAVDPTGAMMAVPATFNNAGTPLKWILRQLNRANFLTWLNLTWNELLARDPNSDLPFRHGHSQEFEPPEVDNIQRLRVSYDTGVRELGKRLFAHAEISWQKVLGLIRGEISLGDVLAVRNFTTNTAVLGGFGLFQRGSAPNVTRLLGLLPATVAGMDADYAEPVEFVTVLQNGANAMTPTQKAAFAATLGLTGGVNAFTGTVTGNRCLEDADTDPEVLSTRVYGLVGATDAPNQTLGHPFGDVDLAYTYYVQTGPKAYRQFADAYIKNITPFNFDLDIPTQFSPFTGRLELKPATPTA